LVPFSLLGTALAIALALGAAAAAQPAPAPAHPTPGGDAFAGSQELRQADAARFAAMVAGDRAALERMLGSDLSYTHSNGLVQDRAQFLAALQKRTLRYESMAPSDVAVRLYGDTGVVTGRIDMKVVLDG